MKHAWVEGGETYTEDGERVMQWECDACGSTGFSPLYKDVDRLWDPNGPHEAWPPCYDGCDEAMIMRILRS